MSGILLSEETFSRIMAVVAKVEAGGEDDGADDPPRRGAAGFDPPSRGEGMRLRFGVCLSVAGNVATLRPCTGPGDATPTGAADIHCWIGAPFEASGGEVLKVDVGKIYDYVRVPPATVGAPRGRLMPVNPRVGC
jgi:hypothetical protein